MSLETIEINRFKKRINTFSRWFFRYKEFVDLSSYIESLLTPEQKQILECKYGEEIIDFKLQLLLYFEDRYDSGLDLEELKEKASKVLKKYFFLFETNLDFSQIRTILLRELIEVISIGSQCFWYRKLSATEYLIYKNKCSLFGIFESPDFMKIEIMKKYPNLPDRVEKFNNKNLNFKFLKEFFWNNYKLLFEDNYKQKKWKNEFFKKTKWFFEYLQFCQEEYRNKYREKIYQEACFAIGVGKNYLHSKFKKIYTLNVEENANTYLQEIVSEILSYFEKAELEKFKKIDSQGEAWSFKEQLLDRYYSRYPSLAPLEELKEQIKKIVSLYKPLLLIEDQTETAIELLIEELEKKLFTSNLSNVWNKEMIGNLYFLKNQKISKSVKWAVEQTIKFIGSENIEKLSIKIEGKEYDLKILLTSRWSRALLSRGKIYFKTRILIFVLKNYSVAEITRTRLQSILEELDSCFIYPCPNRIKKFLLRKDGTEDIPKWKKNIWIKYIELRKNSFFSWILRILLLILSVIVLIVLMLYIEYFFKNLNWKS